jgi:hypothetical protein
LIKGDVEIASMAFGVGTAGAQLAVNGAAGAARRVSGFFNKARHSPMSPFEVRKMFRQRGYTAMEADAIIEAMADTGVSALSIRTFGKKAAARQGHVSRGMQQKPMQYKDKTGPDAILHREGHDYTSDMDLFHVEINGRNATPLESERFFKRANEIYERKWIAAGKASPRIEGGLCRPPNPPFQHGTHLDLAKEWGNRIGNEFIDNTYIAKTGHPGDCITIRRDGSGNLLVHDTPRWWINDKLEEYGRLLSNRQFTLEYRITGTELRVTPAVLSVPKTIAGSVLVEVVTADGATNDATASLAEGAYVEAVFRGPSFPARRLVAPPNAPLMLPPLALVGDYSLDGIRLVDSNTGETRMEATPSSVPVRVFDEVLISKGRLPSADLPGDPGKGHRHRREELPRRRVRGRLRPRRRHHSGPIPRRGAHLPVRRRNHPARRTRGTPGRGQAHQSADCRNRIPAARARGSPAQPPDHRRQFPGGRRRRHRARPSRSRPSPPSWSSRATSVT